MLLIGERPGDAVLYIFNGLYNHDANEESCGADSPAIIKLHNHKPDF